MRTRFYGKSSRRVGVNREMLLLRSLTSSMVTRVPSREEDVLLGIKIPSPAVTLDSLEKTSPIGSGAASWCPYHHNASETLDAKDPTDSGPVRLLQHPGFNTLVLVSSRWWEVGRSSKKNGLEKNAWPSNVWHSYAESIRLRARR